MHWQSAIKLSDHSLSSCEDVTVQLLCEPEESGVKRQLQLQLRMKLLDVVVGFEQVFEDAESFRPHLLDPKSDNVRLVKS